MSFKGFDSNSDMSGPAKDLERGLIIMIFKAFSIYFKAFSNAISMLFRDVGMFEKV